MDISQNCPYGGSSGSALEIVNSDVWGLVCSISLTAYCLAACGHFEWCQFDHFRYRQFSRPPLISGDTLLLISGGVEMWRGGLGRAYLLADPFGCRCLNNLTLLRFHIPLFKPDVRFSRGFGGHPT